jgi:aldehyde dehydrogenase (NAD+)
MSTVTLPRTDELSSRVLNALGSCGVDIDPTVQVGIVARTPLTGEPLMIVPSLTPGQVCEAIDAASEAFLQWRTTPAPVRGLLVKRLGELLTEHQAELAELVCIEAGKIRTEALGEVQEMIDICDLAVGLSRQVGGMTLPSERPGHRLMETWHPLGVVGVISAFNFPVAVWAWNTTIALVCGNAVVWKPSDATPLTALACDALLQRAVRDTAAPPGVHQLLVTDLEGAAALVDSPKVPLISATGSERMGRDVAPRVAARFGRTLLELGGNNGAIVTPSADLDLAARAITFAAAGTAGQRCTTMRRLFVHENVVDDLLDRLTRAFDSIHVGDPLAPSTLVGPLIDRWAFDAMQTAITRAEADGGTLVTGGTRVRTDAPGGYYVRPAIMRMPAQTALVHRETFAPLLYVLTYRTLSGALDMHNAVPQGLSSAIFTGDVQEAELFMSSAGSDCGIANVNLGTSGAEIGGAFGGEKTTGGGRESGSDAWKGYMRRATNTINYSSDLPLAQGVRFG